ncbi:hypothetical protein BH11GEM2_BH11GEM2_34550 [soil metagenome]
MITALRLIRSLGKFDSLTGGFLPFKGQIGQAPAI